MKKSILLFFLLLGTFNFSSAQVTSVKYLIEYNDVTGLYDCKIVIMEGSATTYPQRLQFNAQYTVVVPTGAQLSIQELYNPLENNQTYTGTIPCIWEFSVAEIAPPIQPENDFHAIFPNLSPPSAYNNLSAGDTITLFSISVDVDPCENAVRPFINGQDPSSIDMPNGSDFSNGFTLGSVEQIYDGNLNTTYSGGNWTVSLPEYNICENNCVELVPDMECAPEDLTYLWSTGETTPTITVCPDVNTDYTVNISGPNSAMNSASNAVLVTQALITAFSGPNTICALSTTTVIPSTGGTWITDNAVVAVVTNAGVVTGITEGSTMVIYTDGSTGCSSEGIEVFVNALPAVNITGSDSICVNGTTTLTPNTGGVWISDDAAVATVDNSGNVTGVGAGTAEFIFTDISTGCQSEPSETVWVLADPEVEITGDDRLCIGETTTVSSNQTGTWVSNNPSVATVDPSSGIVTGVSQGTTTITLTDNIVGCTATTLGIIVDDNPSVSTNFDSICITSTATLSPGIGGVWTAMNPAIASLVGNTVTGVASGDAGFIFTSDVTGCSSDILYINVDAGPTTTLTGPNQICVGGSTTIEPNVGGSWAGSDPTIATIDNFGHITGVGAGVVSFTFTSATTLCASNPSEPIYVSPQPIVSAPETSLCIDETMNLSPAFGGTWVSDDASVATVNAFTGEVTPVSSGSVRFTFTDATSGCHATTEIVTVHPTPLVEFTAPNVICAGFTTAISPISGGTWTSSDVSVAQVDNLGNVTGILPGTAHLVFTDTNTGCTSDFMIVTVLASTPVSITGDTEICIGGVSTLSPTTGGTWASNDPSIATVTNTGVVTGVGSGSVTFTFTSDSGSCISETDAITVSSCMDPYSCEGINPDDVICDYTVLSSIDGQLQGAHNNFDQPLGDLCEGGDEAGNIVWFGFFALEGDYDIVIKNSNCYSQIAGITGVQVGLYSNCDFDESSKIFCEVNYQVENEISISSDLLVAGEVYYLFIDGLGNALCEIDIDVNGEYDDSFCNELSKVTGTAYIDANENGIFDTGETPLRNVLISLFPGNFSVLTNDEGKYIIDAPKGGATLTAQANEGDWEDDFLVLDDVSVLEVCVEDINFGFVPSENTNLSATLSVSNTIVRCDWETRFYITVENTGSAPFDGLLEFEFDDKASFFSSPIPNLNINGNIASTETGELLPFVPREYQITLKMPSGSANLPVLDFNTALKDANEAQVVEYSYGEQLRCSYDPNDKREFPDRPGDENLTLFDEDIEYTVRFQNNGNDTAFLVKIVDELDPSIDPRSIRVVNASHDVETCIDDNKLIFMFENINLVDSMTNYEASQGFVTFKCSTKPGIEEFTPVFNSADIIFDTNPPIITNITINTLVSKLCTDVVTELDIDICDGDNYYGYEESGTYTNTIPSDEGCDSTVIIHLEVQGITYSAQDIDLCQGESIVLNGIVYSPEESQEVTDTILNDNGCISNVLTYDFKVIPTQYVDIDTTICEGMDYNGLDESGTYTIDSFDPETGCDIFTTIELEVLPLSDPACVVGLEEVLESEIKMYPNPAAAIVFIESQTSIETISIYSTSYQKIEDISYNIGLNKVEINTSKLSGGLYFVAIKTSGRLIYKKLIIE